MKNKFYITTPLYYVNASPHIGHSYTNIAADCLARSKRKILGENNVWFLTGTDEHGQKIQKAAQEAGLDPIKFTDKMVLQFIDLWRELKVDYNDFIRTTENRHIVTVKKVLEILYKKGDIYQDKYEGWYCTPCETFWIESQITDQSCPDCKRPLEKISETNYFFKLSNYQSWLIGHIRKHFDFIKPASRHEEVLRFLELNRLNDLCISRPKERMSWGIPLPFSPEHVTYVWFDALINYISAVGYFDQNNRYISKWWPADVHLIGKDILRQHAVYWPIMLHALGFDDLDLPKTIFAHGWWLIAQDKMSKSRGNVVSPIDMVNKFSIDVYRYFLLRDVPFGQDGNFSEEAIIKRFNGDLANDLGNLVYRTLTMIEKYFQGNIPDININNIKYDSSGDDLRAYTQVPFYNTIGIDLEDFNFSSALEKTWEQINRANKYIEQTKPWILAKENKTENLKAFIRLLVEVIRKVAEDLMPFMPDTASKIKEQIEKDKIKKAPPLFPRII